MDNLFMTELSVSELTSLIKQTLEQGFYGLKVTGEISNFRPSSTGHWFFTLKDASCSISAVMFKGSTWKVDFTPQEGDKVTVTGGLDVYGARGTYQLKCDTMEKSGFGQILAMLEMRKRHYASLGYFDEKTKKAIPKLPLRVGVVTSPTGAALQDILNILERRAPSLDVLVLPATVQGEGAASSIANRIQQANNLLLCDVLIVGRGGGSIEDLLPFSEESVIEAIHASEIPVVSAVGHEIDWALSDFVADLRAPTPSAAAELVSQGYLDYQNQVANLHVQLQRSIENRLLLAESKVRRFDTKAMGMRINSIISAKEYLLANAGNSLVIAQKQLLKSYAGRLELAIRELQALSPLAILARGYAVVHNQEGKLVASRMQAEPGSLLTLTFTDGSRKALVKE
ncbi:MAG: exodeoxyribonuclease VII large subunit [Sphaerochaeta sp.]|jgi:exodeoxyribonuclease VII large subunit|nr:exodeoxyribonuclease VII large subunit [Sphaerochaeta sp.]HPE93398.1 exodeoxyribonuclease VII large subunit [Sphaerochaeta sp.]